MEFDKNECPWQAVTRLAPTAYSIPVEGSCDADAAHAARAAALAARAAPQGAERDVWVAAYDVEGDPDHATAVLHPDQEYGYSELALREGEEVEFQAAVNDQWWTCRRLRDGAVGIVPVVYLALPVVPVVYGAALQLVGCVCQLPYCELKANGAQKTVYGHYPLPEQCALSALPVVVLSANYEAIGRGKPMDTARNGRQVQTGDVVGVFPASILASHQDVVLGNSLLPHAAAFMFAVGAKKAIAPVRGAGRRPGIPGLVRGEVVEFTPALIGKHVFGQLAEFAAGHEDLAGVAFFKVAGAAPVDAAASATMQRLAAARAKEAADHRPGGLSAAVCTGASYDNPRICLGERACTWDQSAQRCLVRSGL